MTLCISSHALRESGGMERYTLTLVRGLHVLGVRPTLVAKSFDPTLAEYGWVDAVHVGVRALPQKLRDPYFDWRLRRLDLHPLLACNLTGAADLAVCGGTHPGFLVAMQKKPGWFDRRKIALERSHLTRARFVVAHSRLMADEVRRYYSIDTSKIELMYPPVDAERFAPVTPAERMRLRRELQLPAERCIFLLASTGHRRKGLDALVRYFAATELPASLVVAGRPIDIDAPHVRYLGYRKDIENVFRAVDFTVLASLYEPFGLVGIESVLCGSPVVVADNAGCAEVLREPAGLPFRLDDAAGFDGAIRQAVDRWRAGAHRIEQPLESLGYDPSTHKHVRALLDLAARVAR